MLKVSLKGLWGHKRRLVGTILAVFLGVSFLSGTLALNDTVRANFNDLFNDVYKGTDAVVRSSASIKPGGRGAFEQRGLVDASLLPRGGTASARLALAWSSHRLLLWNAGARWPRQHAAQSRGRGEERPGRRAGASNAEPTCRSPTIDAARLGRPLTRTLSRR